MLAVRDAKGYRLVNRHQAERTAQYPELACLAQLPAGIILDGEMVVLQHGQPDFRKLLSRDQAGQCGLIATPDPTPDGDEPAE